MKIIFESREEKTRFEENIATSNICPSDIGLPEYCNERCRKCWKQTINDISEVRKNDQG